MLPSSAQSCHGAAGARGEENFLPNSPCDVLLPSATKHLPVLPSSIWQGGFPAQCLDLPAEFPGEEWDVGGHGGDLLARLSRGQVLCHTLRAGASDIPAQSKPLPPARL